MAITNSDDYYRQLWVMEAVYWAQIARTPTIKSHYSGWLTQSGATGAVPTTWAACSKSTPGALQYTNAGTNLEKRLHTMSVASNTSKIYPLWDRLGACGGIDPSNTGVQAVNTTEVTRGVLASGANLVWFVEVHSAPGATGRNLTLNGTDYGSASRTPVVAIPASAPATLLLRVETPGYYLRTVESVQLSGSMGAGGNLGLVAMRLIHNPEPAVNACISGPAQTGMARIENDSCLMVSELAVMATSGDGHGIICLMEG